jgi:hypothetical protein
MPLTDKMSVIAEYMYNQLLTNMGTLGLAAVYYGDQDKIPTTPVACVEPDTKTRTLNGAPRKTAVDLSLYVLVYHSGLRDPQSNRQDADILAERIEDFFHEDRTLGDQVIDCMVSTIESGYAQKTNDVMRASRLTLTARTQQMLPYEQGGV